MQALSYKNDDFKLKRSHLMDYLHKEWFAMKPIKIKQIHG